MNKSNYTNPEDLIINTLENAIYLNVKNDLSFLIDSRMSLYEHQSTVNPNIPLRNLEYVADLYSAFTKDANLYGSKLIKIPTPQFVVFYNGKKAQPERQVIKLSEAFEVQDREVNLELKVLVLNINPGNNTELMENCKTLADYMKYVDRVRTYVKEMPIEEAVERAINECIKDDILAKFLKKNKAEARKMSIYEFDEEKYRQALLEDGREEGREEGRKEGIKEGIKEGEKRLSQLNLKLISERRFEDLEKISVDERYRKQLYEFYGI